MPRHLTVSMRVIRAYTGVRSLTPAEAASKVQEVAARMAEGDASLETRGLAARLEDGTRCRIAELAVHAKEWPRSP
jgi:hypothetical protein